MARCLYCGQEKKLIKHHESYNPEKIVYICQSCHYLLHSDKCFVCREYKIIPIRWLVMANPLTGKGYNDTFIHPRTGNLNHPWPSKGRWVAICDNCQSVIQEENWKPVKKYCKWWKRAITMQEGQPLEIWKLKFKELALVKGA